MRICIDLDGTICELRKESESYRDLKPKPGAKDFIDQLKKSGHTIIINTARNMGSQGHNVGKVIKNVGKVTLDWLDEHEIAYDEIFFGKPNAEITIDDRCVRFSSWNEVSEAKLKELAREK